MSVASVTIGDEAILGIFKRLMESRDRVQSIFR